MRESKERDIILSIVNESNEHLTAQEIYELARKVKPNISLGTVYRDLNQLTINKKIVKLNNGDGKYRYDNILIKHHYFTCEKCGKVIDIYQDFEISPLVIPGNKILDYDIHFKGICLECNGKE